MGRLWWCHREHNFQEHSSVAFDINFPEFPHYRAQRSLFQRINDMIVCDAKWFIFMTFTRRAQAVGELPLLKLHLYYFRFSNAKWNTEIQGALSLLPEKRSLKRARVEWFRRQTFVANLFTLSSIKRMIINWVKIAIYIFVFIGKPENMSDGRSASFQQSDKTSLPPASDGINFEMMCFCSE